MKVVKQAGEYTILQRGDNRYAVRGKDKRWINGDAKVEILVKEGLLKVAAPAAKPPEPDESTAQASTEETPAEAAEGGDGDDASAEDT